MPTGSVTPAARVLAFAEQLRRDGLDADYVLLVCTPAYRRRFLGLEAFGQGRGVKWEAKVLHNILYDQEENTRFIPVLFPPAKTTDIPETVQDVSRYVLAESGGSDTGYTQLIQRFAAAGSFRPLRWASVPTMDCAPPT